MAHTATLEVHGSGNHLAVSGMTHPEMTAPPRKVSVREVQVMALLGEVVGVEPCAHKLVGPAVGGEPGPGLWVWRLVVGANRGAGLQHLYG